MTLELNILYCLRLVSPRLQREDVLMADVRMRESEATNGMIRDALRSLEGKGDVTGQTHEDLGLRWKATDEGLVRLREAGI